MPIINTYKPPTNAQPVPALGKPEDPYDINFCIPEGVIELENGVVKLVPFVPAFHAQLYLDGTIAHPDLFDFFPIGPYPTLSAVLMMLEYNVRVNPSAFIYAILDKTRSTSSPDTPIQATKETFAGTIGYLNASPQNASIEIGHVLILPPFQRTHVTTNAVGLCIAHALNRPNGMGLRRVQYQAHALNTPSMRVAGRLGFRPEGVMRWVRIWPEGRGRAMVLPSHARTNEEEKVVEVPEGDDAWGPNPSADSWMSSICWDDWVVGRVKEKVEAAMAWRDVRKPDALQTS